VFCEATDVEMWTKQSSHVLIGQNSVKPKKLPRHGGSSVGRFNRIAVCSRVPLAIQKSIRSSSRKSLSSFNLDLFDTGKRAFEDRPNGIIPHPVSNPVRICRIWHSNRVVDSRFSANQDLKSAHPFNRVAFLHPFKQFPNPVSEIARDFRI
jgi:hypothetical protein